MEAIIISLIGFVMGATMMVMITPNDVRSNKPIIPQKVLTTDGKTVDTLYIYKLK